MIRSQFLLKAQTDISPDEVMQWVERILKGHTFVRSYRLSLFLRFAVEQSLNGLRDQIKEYTIGTEVYGRNSDFDPSVDSIVRVEARRLRKKLVAYYEAEGASDEILISFRPGSYVPSYRRRPILPLTARNNRHQASSCNESEASCAHITEPKLIAAPAFRTEGGRLYIIVNMLAPSSATSWSHRLNSPATQWAQLNVGASIYGE